YDEVVELIAQRHDPETATEPPDDSAPADSSHAPAAGAAAAGPDHRPTHRADVEGRQAADARAQVEAEADAPAAAANSPADSSAEPVILARSSIVLDGSATDAASGIDEAGSLLVAAGAVDESYVQAMHDREATVSTFMGNGLAIPHGTGD